VLVQATKEGFPRTIAGRAAYGQLERLDRLRAETALLGRPTPKRLDDSQRWWLVQALGHYVSDGAVVRLREQMEEGGTAGDAARSVLEGRGLLGMKAINALAARWRKTRSPDDLHALYVRYVANQVGKVSLKSLLKLLGRPNRRDGRLVWYMPNRDTALFLEADAKGVLESTKFT
jgi:hypothetical protein